MSWKLYTLIAEGLPMKLVSEEDSEPVVLTAPSPSRTALAR